MNSNTSQAAARHVNHGHHNYHSPKASPLTQRSLASQNNETPTMCSDIQHTPNNKSCADRGMTWWETSRKCSYILCINYASQAVPRQINSRHSNSRQCCSTSRSGSSHHMRHPAYISGLHPRGQQRTTGTKSHTPKWEIPRTQAVARHNKTPQTIIALISRVAAPMLVATS